MRAIVKVLALRVVVVVLTRTPVNATGKTTHNGLVEIQLVQLIPGWQIPIGVATQV